MAEGTIFSGKSSENREARSSSIAESQPFNQHQPTFVKMVIEAVEALNDRKGSSMVKICKWIESKYDIDTSSKSNMNYIKKALKKALTEENLVKATGKPSSLTGSFRLPSVAEKKVKAAEMRAAGAKKLKNKKEPNRPKKPESVAKPTVKKSGKVKKPTVVTDKSEVAKEVEEKIAKRSKPKPKGANTQEENIPQTMSKNSKGEKLAPEIMETEEISGSHREETQEKDENKAPNPFEGM